MHASPTLDETFSRKYWCFISYKHSDNVDEGRQWASWLHQQLETYEIPSEFVGTTNEKGEEIPSRIYPVFRDESELSAASNLAVPIQRSLENSATLVVICSPRVLQSRYVQEEIVYFKRLGKADKVYAAIVEGEPGATLIDGGKCFPDALRYSVTESGKIDMSHKVEPLASDFRLADGQQGWTTPEAYRQQLLAREDLTHRQKQKLVRDYSGKIEDAKLKLISGILGIPFGRLRERDKLYQLAAAKRRANVRGWLTFGFSIIALIALVAAFGFFLQREEAARQRDNALSRLLAAEGHRRASLSLAAGLPYFLASLHIANNPSAMSGLFRSLQHDPHMGMQILPTTQTPTCAAIRSRFDAAVVGFENGDVLLWRLGSDSSADGEAALRGQPSSIKLEGGPEAPILRVAFDEHGRKITALDALGGLYRWTLTTGRPENAEQLATLPVAEAADSDDGAPEVALSANGNAVAVVTWDRILVWRPSTGLSEIRLPNQAAAGSVALSDDGRQLASVVAGLNPPVVIYNLEDERVIDVPPPRHWPGAIDELRFSPDGKYLAGSTSSFDGTVMLWDLYSGTRFLRYVDHPKNDRPNITPRDARIVFDETSTYVATYHRRRWHIWDLATGILIGDPIQSSTPISAYAGGRPKLLISTADNVLQLMDHSFHHLRYWACLTSPQSIPADEWRDVVGGPSPQVDNCPRP